MATLKSMGRGDGLAVAERSGSTESKLAKELALLNCFTHPSLWERYVKKEQEKKGGKSRTEDWRSNKEKIKTNHILLLLCLNVGIDPPDVLRVEPCAKLECWTDPIVEQSKLLTKGSGVIAKLLEQQYKSLQKHVVCMPCLEPNVADLKLQLKTLRRTARDGRVLVHYNGHGVPRVTPYGELWFFNIEHNQYVPLTITEIMEIVGSPTIYVLDCSNAGAILQFWYKHGYQNTRKRDIIICSCGQNEDLPMNPALPADLLTSCLTTPIRASLEWYYLYSQRECLLPNVTHDMIDKVPGCLTERKTPLGELQWIFTAVTDAIAWCTLPREQFNNLFRPRNDILLVALFRNYLLAQRIIRETGCQPVSHPPLPDTHAHPMWEAWELALEAILSQLPALLEDPKYVYRPTSFFSEQLTAFELWVEFGSKEKGAPDQLPCIIQGLSSHQYRVRSLRLLARYLDLGEWAVVDSLSCGILPYVTRLLHQLELINLMVVIWTRILLVDRAESTYADLFRPQSPPARQFIKVLASDEELCTPPAGAAAGSSQENAQNAPPVVTSPVESPQADTPHSMEGCTPQQCQALACFIFCVLMDGYGATAQVSCWNWHLLVCCTKCLRSEFATIRSWGAVLLAKLIHGFPEAIDLVLEWNIPEQYVRPLLTDTESLVRASAVYALSHMVGQGAYGTSMGGILKDIELLHVIAELADDPSPMVREEVLHAMGCFCCAYRIVTDQSLFEGSNLAKPPKPFETALPDTRSRLNEEIPSDNYYYTNASKPVSSFPIPTFPLPGTSGSSPFRKSFERPPSRPVSPAVDGKTSGNLMEKLRRDVTEVLRWLANDVFPPLVAKVAEVVKAPWEKENSSMYDASYATASGPATYPRSELFKWLEAQMRKPIFKTEGAAAALEKQKWREQCNKDMLQVYLQKASERHFLPTPSCKAERITKDKINFAHLNSGGAPKAACVRFRSLEPQVVIADTSNTVHVVDTNTGSMLNSFKHRAPIRHTFVLNDATESPSLLVVDNRSVVSVYSGIIPQKGKSSRQGANLDSSFRACKLPSANCQAEWQSTDRVLLFAGEPGALLMYSLETERLLQTLVTTMGRTGGRNDLTVLRADDSGSRKICGGFEDGSIRCWDARNKGVTHHLLAWLAFRDGADPVVDLFFRSNSHQLYSGHRSGLIKVWDMRSQNEMKVEGYSGKRLTNFSMHHMLPLMLCGLGEGDAPATLEFVSTRNENLGDITIPKTRGPFAMALHPFQPMAVVDWTLMSF